MRALEETQFGTSIGRRVLAKDHSVGLRNPSHARRHPMNAPLTASDLPRGFTFAGMHCGLKKSKLDLRDCY